MVATIVPSLERFCVTSIACLITIAGWGMFQSACRTLWLGASAATFTGLAKLAALGVASLSVASKELLYIATRDVGIRFNSPALIANAHHHRSDAMSSLAAVVGIAGAICGWLRADAIAAAVVGAMVLKLGITTAISGVPDDH